MTSPVTAIVRLHGKPVGVLTYDRGGAIFEYEDDLLDPSHHVLGQIFEDDPRTIRRTKTGLPSWFANLLPEGGLRRQVIREMGGGRVGDYRLLARLGSDLPGAVTVEAATEPDDSDDVTADEAVSAVPDQPLRYSLAGVQLKYSVHSSRLTLPTRGGGGWWIVKLPDRALPHLAENEYLTMRWLTAAGMAVPRVELVAAESVQGVPAGFVQADDVLFLIERFDRRPEGRRHVEDFAQVADVDPKHKYGEFGATYDTVGRVIRHLIGESGFDVYVSRLVAMLVTGNTDAHLKNWALWYPDGRRPELSPVYDFHSLSVYQHWRHAPLALRLAGEQMPNLIGREHLRRLAESCGSDPDRAVNTAAETVERLRAGWDGEIRREARKLYPALADHYEQRVRELPIVRA